MIRLSTLKEAQKIYSWMCTTTQPGKRGDAVTRFIWWALGLIGVAIFIGGFGFWLMPLFAGWAWIEAFWAWMVCMWISKEFLYFPEAWARVSAWLWMTKTAALGGRGAITKALKDHLRNAETTPTVT